VPSVLRLDLRYEPDLHDPHTASLGDVVSLARRPRALSRALSADRSGDLEILVDDCPLSGVQALVLLAVSALHKGRVALVAPTRRRRLGRGRFLVRALLEVVRRVPGELVATARLYRRAQAATTHDPRLARRVSEVESVLYVRTEPNLRWHGHLVGGASTHTSGVVNGFVSNGLEVEVMAAERPEWTDRARFTPVPVRRLYHLVPWLTLADYGEAIAAAATGRRPGFVYQRYSVGAWTGLRLAERFGVPLVLEYNGSELWVQTNWGAEHPARLTAPLSALERRNVESASLVVVVSDVLKDQLVEGGIASDRVLVAPNGVDVERLRRYRERTPEAWRSELGLAAAPTIGFVGSFGVWHGVRLLPPMVARVAEAIPGARWQLIGDGDLHAEIRDEIVRRGLAANVTMPGVVPHERALELLASCDVCVSPHVPNADGSRFFGSPTKLFEYMGLAKPIVASDLEQLGEVVVDGESGLLCPPGDPDAAASAAVRLLGEPELRARLGAAALERATAAYSWRAHTARILDALRSGGAVTASRLPARTY
jgi:glycosyltransferase involved in cell wall biosynthesis